MSKFDPISNTMLTFHPLFWFLVALFFAIVHPAASHPIRTSKWVQTTHFEDQNHRGVWKVFEEFDKNSLLGSPRARPSQLESPSQLRHDTDFERRQSGLLYKRDTSSDKPMVSVLVPHTPISERLHRHWKHPQAEDYEYPWKPATPTTKHYGEMLGQTEARMGMTGYHGQSSQSSSSSSLRLSSGNYISFFSYRISFPFLKFAPASASSFPLPGIFTTIMILLAMVWIAILAIGLVEVGNYLWSRGRASPLAGESGERESGDESRGSDELVKEPFQVLVIPRIPRREIVSQQDEDDVLVSDGVN